LDSTLFSLDLAPPTASAPTAAAHRNRRSGRQPLRTVYSEWRTSSRRRLRSSTLAVPVTRRATLGDRSFPVAATRTWNALLTSARYNVASFSAALKTYLFSRSFWQRQHTSLDVFLRRCAPAQR